MAEHTPSPQEKEASSGIRITRLHSLFIGIGVLALVGLFLMISASPGKKTIPISEIQIQKVSASSELLFHFDEAVNQKSVEEELVIPDGVSGDISWKDGVMIYDPSEPLVEGAKYRFAVTKKALKADNTAFGKQKDFAFQVAGTPHLISRIPEIDAVEVPTDGSITMVFDMPMIPLTQIQGAAADRRFQDWTATISPPLPGHWRWLGTTTIAYVPDEGLKAATKYTISVPAGISTPLGDQTQEDYSWSFETQRPEAQAINPVPIEGETIQQYGPKSQVLLSFNLPMSLGSAKDHIRFYREEINAYKDPDPLANTTEMSLKAHRYHRFETENGAETDETTLVLEPVETLEFNGTYMIQISAGITSTEGDLGSPEDQFFHFSTVGDLTVMRGYYEYFGIQLDFSNSIVEETLRPNLSIDPLPEDWENTDVQVYSWDKSYLRFYPQLRPSTLYTVRINTGLRDQFGQSLKEPYQFEFTTEPVPSRVFIHSDGEFGIFERERPPVYYLNAVNVSELTLKFTPLSLTDFLDLREKQESSYDFRPDFSGYKDSKSLTLQPPKKVHDQWEAIPFDLEEQWGELGSGIYGFSMQAPEYTDYNGNSIIEVQYFALTDMALTLKNSGSKALVWLTNTQTG
ncbi:MAG: Ig-like domain-containing protein, partial [Candidatus Gracilibacteria bacterium]|nr:Ig-like domain-containing protein [Candidatus Gracilibacteria bacterium]